MPLLGKAAVLLTFDIEEAAIAEHDDWHTHEHLPERLSIRGFLRGTRWTSVQGSPRYAVMYEVDHLDTLASPAYLQRLNNPTPWTSKMMSHYRRMTRGLCSVERSYGFGSGGYSLLVQLNAIASSGNVPVEWLLDQGLSRVPSNPGVGSAHLLRGAFPAAMTSEQQIRGVDVAVDWALMVTGYDPSSLVELEKTAFSAGAFHSQGCARASSVLYQIAYTLSANEIDA